MSIRYDSKREPVAAVLRKATADATLVIPDLQRPYVWTPRQVTLLVDSLFRGWPFGSLLLWEVKPDCFQDNEGIPHRAFWQLVDRTSDAESTSSSPLAQPATYQMVLDGQQRVQSLVIALGGDQWGFKLYDADWAADLQDRRLKPAHHWSRGSLCLDLEAFRGEIKAKTGKVRRMEVAKALDWVILDLPHGHSTESRPQGYTSPLPLARLSPGRYIRLSRLWALTQNDMSESEYEETLTPLLAEHRLDDRLQAELLRPLAQFMKLVETVKANSYVHVLQIESFVSTAQWTKDDYSDAIVTIFTRLNTAGRTLTREDITLAWLKVGWIPSATGGKNAGSCLEELRTTLGEHGLSLDTDDVVRLVSFSWAIDRREGALLDSKDLLKGDVVRPMASAVASTWTSLRRRILQGVELLKERDLVENLGSFNAVIVFVTWLRLVMDRMDDVARIMRVADKDDIEKELAARVGHFADRWIFSSQWAGFWGEHSVRNLQDLATDLTASAKQLQTAASSDFLATVDKSIQHLMDRVTRRAIANVGALIVRERSRVYLYYSFLWMWHRLDSERWKCSSVPMRTGRKRTSKLEVDHVIADAWWYRFIMKLAEEKRAAFAGPEEEKARLAPGDFTSAYEALSFINSLGNCSLLDKSFNVSKSDQSMWSFLGQVHEFKKGTLSRTDWERALSLTPTMTEPAGRDLATLVGAIQTRDALIRGELMGFVQGERYRVDLD